MFGCEEIKYFYMFMIDVVIYMMCKIVYDVQGCQVWYECFVDEVYFDLWVKLYVWFGDCKVGQGDLL